LIGIDEKRDLLRQMMEGTVPTKVNKRKDRTVEQVLGALEKDTFLFSLKKREIASLILGLPVILQPRRGSAK